MPSRKPPRRRRRRTVAHGKVATTPPKKATHKPVARYTTPAPTARASKSSKQTSALPASQTKLEGSTHARRPHRNVTSDDALIRRVAFLYCFGSDGKLRVHSYSEIAEILGPEYKRQVVGALVREAIALGYLVVYPTIPYAQGDLDDLAHHLKITYGLRSVRLVPGDPKLFQRSEDPQATYRAAVVRAIVQATAEYLDEFVAHTADRQFAASRNGGGIQPNCEYIALAWGRSLMMLAELLRSTARLVSGWKQWLECVPAIGIQGAPCREAVEANIIAITIAIAYDVQASQLACPAFVTKDYAAAFREIPDIKATLQKISKATILVTSLGAILPEERYADMKISHDPKITEAIVRAARRGEGVGEILGRPFDAAGNPVPIDDYEVMGIRLDEVRAIAADPSRHVLLMCGGDARKVDALRAALAGRYVSDLITDTETAKALLHGTRGELHVRRPGTAEAVVTDVPIPD